MNFTPQWRVVDSYVEREAPRKRTRKPIYPKNDPDIRLYREERAKRGLKMANRRAVTPIEPKKVTKCRRGHLRTPENLQGRSCKLCKLVTMGRPVSKREKRTRDFWIKKAERFAA